MKYSNGYVSDLLSAIEIIPNYSKLNNCKILVTGSTGMIGSAIIDVLLTLNEKYYLNINIYAASRNKNSVYERFENRENLFYVNYDANEPINSNIVFDYIIHAASNSSPDLYLKEPVETMTANIIGLKNIFDYVLDKECRRILYISSSEVYGKKATIESHTEDNYGFVDILSVRSCYPVAKRAAETLCISYSNEYGIESVIVRPGHIYGPTATKKDTRVASLFAREAAIGGQIILKSSGTQLRSYCYSIDCATAIITVLINGKNGEAYNISNKDSIVTISEMAKSFAKAGGIKVEYDIPNEVEKQSFNPMDNSSLNSKKIESLGWQALTDMDEGAKHTVENIRINL